MSPKHKENRVLLKLVLADVVSVANFITVTNRPDQIVCCFLFLMYFLLLPKVSEYIQNIFEHRLI